MQLLAISGSPRSTGYSTRLLEAALQVFSDHNWTITRFNAARKDISPCTGCGGCQTTGHCVLPDPLTALSPAFLSADAVLVSSPLYFYSVSSQLKALIDRCQPFWVRRNLLMDPALIARPLPPCAFLQVAGGKESPRMFTASTLVMSMWCNTMGYRFGPTLTVTATDTMTETNFEPHKDNARALANRLILSTSQQGPMKAQE